MTLAYNTGAFSRASKVKPLSYYLKQIRGGSGRPPLAAEALAFFGGLKAKGLPVSIERVPRRA